MKPILAEVFKLSIEEIDNAEKWLKMNEEEEERRVKVV